MLNTHIPSNTYSAARNLYSHEPMPITTMASSANNLTRFYSDNLCKSERKHNVTVLVDRVKWSKVGRVNRGSSRQSLSVRANIGSYNTSNMETVNGKKVNGTHVGIVANLGERGSKEQSNEERAYLMGRFVEDRFVYRQTFAIRSYEIGPDKTATMETLMNLLQETALNHVTCSGLAGNGFGATREMSIRKLIWVVTRIHVQVEKYSSWGDVVEIDTWVDAAGKNGMKRDWIIRDYVSQKIITRATSTWVIMNRETRRLCKIPDEVRNEVVPFYLNRAAIAKEDTDSDKIEKLTDETAGRIRSNLAPSWSDMDANQHVNNVKYIGWILESVPMNVLEEYYLSSMTLEYRRECRQSDLLDSLTSMQTKVADQDSGNTSSNDMCTNPGSGNGLADMECTHLLRMQNDKAEIVRGRSVWLSKHE